MKEEGLFTAVRVCMNFKKASATGILSVIWPLIKEEARASAGTSMCPLTDEDLVPCG